MAPSRLTTTATTPSLSVSRGCNANCSGGRILSAYYARFTQDNAHYLSVSGNERRDSFDVRIYAKTNGFDGDLEVMGQTGSIGNDDIGAWAVGSLSGYTFANIWWTPRLGFQFDAASGNSNPHGNVLQTFNPLFPNGYYFTLAGYTGYSNLIHLKPAVVAAAKSLLGSMSADRRVCAPNQLVLLYRTGSVGSANDINRLDPEGRDVSNGCPIYGRAREWTPLDARLACPALRLSWSVHHRSQTRWHLVDLALAFRSGVRALAMSESHECVR